MTTKTFQAKLAEILQSCDFEPEELGSRICKWCGETQGSTIHTAKQAITALIESDIIRENYPIIHSIDGSSVDTKVVEAVNYEKAEMRSILHDTGEKR